jgi:hypothetical protein
MAQFPIPTKSTGENPDVLAWTQDDIENRFGFKGGRFTGVNHAFAFLMGTMFAAALYALMIFVFIHVPVANKIATMFMRPTNQFAVIPATVFFFWGVSILILKGKKIQFQERALRLSAVPAQPEFILSAEQKSHSSVIEQMTKNAAALQARDATLGLTDLKATIHRTIQEADLTANQEAKVREEMDNLELKVSAAQSRLFKLREMEGQLWLVPDKNNTTKEPILVTVAGKSITVEAFDHPEQRK